MTRSLRKMSGTPAEPMETNGGNYAEWYYVGHYGQLGPLTSDQMAELIQDGVIERDTYIWKPGMASWALAESNPELSKVFSVSQVSLAPPPSPLLPPSRQTPSLTPTTPYGAWPLADASYPRSDRNRILAGILQLLVPGVGRMYLGYAAQGVLQLFLTPFGCGIGWVWSFIDGLIILTGGVKMDGYGRRLAE